MLLLFAIILAFAIQLTKQTIVSIAQGKVRGTPRDGYVAYSGIPYASVAPGLTGRFQRAGIAPVWSDIREYREPQCSQVSAVEECLQLDVNVPNGFHLPVLVWVTGGTGTYNPGKLVKQGIIVVVVRHRLGLQGFLCSSEDKIPGNAGLKDVVSALRWVRDNIVAFNGNPNKVVIGGQGFGAALVESLLLTPTNYGLFHGVIMQSGTVLAPWAFNFDADDRAKFIKRRLNITRGAFILTRTGLGVLPSMIEEVDLPYLPFGICVEKPFKNEERLIAESPFNILSRGNIIKVPMIIGFTANEAYIFISLLREAHVLRRMTKDMSFLLPTEIQLSKRSPGKILRDIDEMYFDNNMTMASVLKYHSDAYFLSHIHRSANFHGYSQDSVYLYRFSHFGNVGVEADPVIEKSGAAHSDELAYLFPDKGRDMDGDDGIVQENLIQLWTDFVKYLNPNPTKIGDTIWNPFSARDPRVLDISTNLEMIEFPYKKEAQMWEDIYEKHYFDERN